MKCNVMGFSVVGLDQRGSSDIFEYTPPARVVYVIGNESKVRVFSCLCLLHYSYY